MAKCDVCGNEYDKAFQVMRQGRTMTFDSFECAIHAMAPSCAHCGCKVVGHGVEVGGEMFCCAHCAGHKGGIRDRAASKSSSRRKPGPIPQRSRKRISGSRLSPGRRSYAK